MKRLLVTILTSLAMLMPTLALTSDIPVYAAGCGSGSDAKNQVLNGIGETGANCASGEAGVNHIFTAIVDILSLIVGVISIIAIISAGFKYVTSGGESAKVGNAKSTIIYAIIGIVIAVLAQLIVRFVVTTTSQAINN